MQSLKESLKYKQWEAAVLRHGVTLRSAEELHTVRKPNGEVLFSMIRIDATGPDGKPILPVVLLRGHFVSVLTCLIDEATGEEFLLLVGQRRVADGDMHYEHPAGMCDMDGDPWSVALKEVEEETGLHITRDQLHLLTPEIVFSSPGLLDEGGYFFSCELRLPRTEIDKFHKASAGEYGEGEFIHTVLASPSDALSMLRNACGIANHWMWVEWRKRNK